MINNNDRMKRIKAKIDLIFVQRLAVVVLATVISFTIGLRFSETTGVVASILAIITLRVSIQASIFESFIQITAVFIGSIIALLSVSLINNTVIIIAIVALFSFLIAKWLNLSDDTGTNIAITALIVASPGFHYGAANERIRGTLIGVIVALILSYWSHPQTPLERTINKISIIGFDISTLLRDISKSIKNRLSGSDQILLRSREINSQIFDLRIQAEEAVRYSKWSPTLAREDALSAYNKHIAIEHIVIQCRNIARSLFDLEQSKEKIPKNLSHNLSILIENLATSTELKSRKLISNYDYRLSRVKLDEIREELKKSIELFGSSSLSTISKIEISSIFQAIKRILDSLSLENPAITDVPTPKISQNPIKEILFLKKILK